MDNMSLSDLIKTEEKERDLFVKAIVSCYHPKKVIVSGPGTGKTYLFGEILKQKAGHYLVLTFINNLADKLNKELGDKARCVTFHSLCKSLLHMVKRNGIDDNFILYPDLNLIIKSDARILLEKDFNFRHCFTKLDRNSQELNFFIERYNYYNAISFDDSVFRVIEHFEGNVSDIPEYEQILVDEYQDFNMLEVTFMDLIGIKSPLLIVGDDDQALYGQLKDASPQYIRDKYHDKQFKNFELPFCSRCTEVIIKAIEDVIYTAKKINKLLNRIEKRYICYLPEKLEDSKKYPKIIHAYCSVQSEKVPYLSKFIEKEMISLRDEEIKEANKISDYTVLITGPHHYLKQINYYLAKNNKEWLIVYKRQEDLLRRTNILEGYRILLDKDRFSNLGWRIILEHDRVKNIKAILKDAFSDKKSLYECLPQNFVEKHELIVGLLEKVKNGLAIDDQSKRNLEGAFKRNLDEIHEYLSEKNKEIVEEKYEKRLSVILTTYVGCKGLSAGYVFAVGLNEGNLPRDNRNPTDIEICQFILKPA